LKKTTLFRPLREPLANSNPLFWAKRRYAIVSPPEKTTILATHAVYTMVSVDLFHTHLLSLKNCMRILIVEDEDINRALLEFHFKRLKHDVVSVTNGLDAIKAIQRESFDLVFMDCYMPTMGGYEATEKIRAGLAGEDKSVIPIYAFTSEEISDKQLDSIGLNGHLKKPFDLNEIDGLMKKVTN